ncbi:MAG TPA: cytochrome c oxidase assembly protein [Rhodospirillaceae bacterium]|nr:cytochrome c oxidase assembly protein [Rhodospirillaceae bacterium]
MNRLSGKARTVLASAALLAVMVGLVCASVPLYSLFCQVTGFGGTAKVSRLAPPGSSGTTMEVRFDASVMKDMPWRFLPKQTHMTVRLGEPSLALFTAENLSHEALTGTATFNVTPSKAGAFVDKIQCFCFSEQHLEPGQKAELPVSFFIDPSIATDPDTNEVRTITLSYTFFKARKPNSEGPS